MTISNKGISTPGISKFGISSNGLTSTAGTMFALNFDGSSIYGQMSARAINANNDVVIEWEQRNVPLTGSHSIVTQCNSDNPDARELQLKWLNGKLWFAMRGSMLVLLTDNVNSADGKWRVQIIGSSVGAYFNDSLVFSVTRSRGISSEPAAPTRVGVLSSGGVLQDYFSGFLFNLKINSRLWPINDKGQSVQQSSPTGNNLTLYGVSPGDWVLI
jgi:hypothetical protein